MTVSVFIVEDDKGAQAFLTDIMKAMEIDIVDIASNGQMAVDRYKSFVKRPDVILMDYRMPLLNGIDAMVEILGIDSKAKVIILSADMEMRKDALYKGASIFLDKPYDLFGLAELIKTLAMDGKVKEK